MGFMDWTKNAVSRGATSALWGGIGGLNALEKMTMANRGSIYGAAIGAGAGGLWGATSDDTSVLGGMALGAGLGAGLGRYGSAGYRNIMGARDSGASTYGALTRAAARGMWGQGKRDARMVAAQARSTYQYFGSKIGSNRAVNKL